LAAEAGLTGAIREFVGSGRPVWGTCAGLILLARDVGATQPLAGGLDVAVERNAFGRQVDSFETDLTIPLIGDRPFRGVFIRAPSVRATGPGVEVVASLDDGTVVAVRQGRVLGTAFHPELSGDDRIHEMFVAWVTERDRDETTP
jgi:5'-phosphate synthase pdxT subunit